MWYRTLQILLLLIPFICITQVATAKLPDTIESLLLKSTVKPLDTDSVYRYLRQQQDYVDGTRFYSLYEDVIDGDTILIYKMINDMDVKVYMCINPYKNVYPSTLLLWSYNRKGVRNWFEIENDIIHTNMICDYWERVYIASQSYEIDGSKFKQIDKQEISIFPEL